jgi:L-ascorbate metabolism protein UlaG (beta-lactamase superfamily)
MEIINKKEIKDGEILIWWLGGASFYLKSQNKKIIIDPYLSNSVYDKLKPFFKEPKKDLSRLISPPLKPSEIDCDYYICTHDHLDHLDLEILKRLFEDSGIRSEIKILDTRNFYVYKKEK